VLHTGQYTNTDNGIKTQKKTQTHPFYSIYVKFVKYPREFSYRLKTSTYNNNSEISL
jgi:hypothetical protein